MGKLTASLKTLVEFLRLDEYLVTAASENSSPLKDFADAEFMNWIKSLSEREKTGWLIRFASSQESRPDLELFKTYQKSKPHDKIQETKLRSVKALLISAQHLAEKHQRKEADRAQREKTRLQHEREKYLDQLALKKSETWPKVEALLQTKKQSDYDIAVTLLKDLNDLAEREGQLAETSRKIKDLRRKYQTRSAFRRRLDMAGL